MSHAERIAEDYVDVVSGDDGTRFLRVRTAEREWTTIISPSGDDLAQHQAKAIRKAIAAAAKEVHTKKPRNLLQRLLWAFLWA